MKNLKAAMAIMLILTMVLTTGCSMFGKKEEEVVEEDKTTAYLKTLENGNYYIRNNNEYTIVKPYFGNATFGRGETADRPDNGRVFWFKEDFDQIPTLYEGDSLIYYTTDILTERFHFERFEDFGYTIGIRSLSVTPSYRYKIMIGKDAKTTYPGGDTDELLALTNESAIIEAIGGKSLRAPGSEEWPEEDVTEITRVGTLIGFTQNTSYKAEVYQGTECHPYVWTANIRVLGSMETYSTVNYFFESETVINIKIPEFFNSGYYMINGVGLFRYVTNLDKEVYNNELAYIPMNEANDMGELGASIYDTAEEESMEKTPTGEPLEPAKYEDTSQLKTVQLNPGNVTITVHLTPESGATLKNTAIILMDPDGGTTPFQQNKAGDALYVEVSPEESAAYGIKIYGSKIDDQFIDIEYDE